MRNILWYYWVYHKMKEWCNSNGYISRVFNDYKLEVKNKYLEQLKLTIKDIIQSDWERTIWLIDKDSELLSITLYPRIYRVENLARQLINEIMTKQYGINWWDKYVPKKIKDKHRARLGGYKSEVPGFNNVDERLMSIEQEQAYVALQDIMTSETGIDIFSEEEIIDRYNEHLYEFHSELEDYLRFRNDLEFTEYEDIALGNEEGLLFEIKYRITEDRLAIRYKIECIDACQGEESTMAIIISTDHNSITHFIGHTNGEVSFNTEQGCYMPERGAEISLEDFEQLKDKLVEFIHDNFENMRETVDAETYEIIKDGGSSPVSEDIICYGCGEEYICVDENYAELGQCLNCGEKHEICQCERCGWYFECSSNSGKVGYYDEMDICEACREYYKQQ